MSRNDSGVGNFIAIDLIIEYSDAAKEGIVLIERKNFPYGLGIPGGLLENYLSPGQNARKEGKEETNLDIIIEDEETPFLVRGHPQRDPRARVLSLVYIVKGYGTLRAGDDAASAKLYSIDEVKDLLFSTDFAFDHKEILQKYLKHRGYGL